MPSLPALTFQGTKAVFDMGGGQKVYMEVATADLKTIIKDTNNPYVEPFTMVYRWLNQRGYTLTTIKNTPAQKTAYDAATYTITLSA